MKRERRILRLRAGVVAIASLVLIYAMISGLQPVFERLLGPGTLFASSAMAQEATLPPSARGASIPSEIVGDTVQQDDSAPQDIFENDPIADLALVLQNKQFELRQREIEIQEEEDRLALLRNEVQQRLTQLTARMEDLRVELMALTAQQDAQRKREVKKLVEIYQSMQAPQAATVLEGLDSVMALEVLLQMESKKAGKILDAMNSEVAITLGEGLRKKQS